MTDAPLSPASGRLVDSQHSLSLRVYYEDTDAAGIVYHAVYLHYAERARTEALRLCGLDHGRLAKEQGLHFAVHRCVVDYLRPARLDDALVIHTRVTAMGGARFELDQSIQRDDTPIARLTVGLVCIDAQGRPVRLPASLQDALRIMAGAAA